MGKNFIIDFLNSAVSPFHAVDFVKDKLISAGFSELSEGDMWQLSEGGKYFVIRNGTSIIAFYNKNTGFNVIASHSDFPAFKVKSSDTEGAYVKLRCEKYGGMIYYSWFDRPLLIGGAVSVRCDEGFEIKHVRLPYNVVIPSVAIHLNRSVNEKFSPSPLTDLVPLAALGGDNTDLNATLAVELSVNPEDIISHDLYLTSADKAVTAGFNNELILSPRLDDIASLSASLEAFLEAGENAPKASVLAVFDNEEIGSDTKQGAASTFLYDTLYRISGDKRDYLIRLYDSFMVSADNAHAKHPQHPELSDKDNAPILGGGVVIKHNANQKYATDAKSSAIFSEICKSAGIRCQHYYNRADMPGGSTLGSISNTKVSVPTVDIGIPQLAMHSAVETMALSDYLDTVQAMKALYLKDISYMGDKVIIK